MPDIDQYQHSKFQENCRELGYQIKMITELGMINSILIDMEHLPTGARHIHIGNDDRENTFSVAFKTVPTDSTGVAHILEHTVLCGSRKFPVRDPFFSMLKRSLNTFMNAFTASDWTMYPFCTQNRKDFYNLMDVYLDASFYPNIDRLSFRQEGHRLEIESIPEKDWQLVYKGVVYNEMKGAMSSPDQVMVRSMLNAMYPETTYSHNSGGDPAVIPTITHEQLKQFHQRHYHPSNAYFYTYGDLPLSEHIRNIHDKVLKHYGRIDPNTEVIPQPRWKGPKRARYWYPLDSATDASKKSQVCVTWLTSDIQDAFQILALKLLEQILLGNSASPLRKALMDSELGTALSDGTGFDADNRDTLFSCGLKDVAESDAEKIEGVVLEVLQNLVEEGIDSHLIDAAIHQVEFHRREITNSPYPYGIKLLLSFVGSWLHGGSSESVLKFDKDLEKIRKEVADNGFFEKQIKRYLLDNPHRALIVLSPDTAMEVKETERVLTELDEIKNALDEEALVNIREDAEALVVLQETTEDISILPTLDLEDIPADIHTIPASRCSETTTATCYNQPTSGIFYTTTAMGIGNFDATQLPLVPFFCYALPKLGTRKRDFTEIVQRIDAYTGGISLASNARTRFDASGMCMPFVTINGKCLNRNLDRMFELIEEILLDVSFLDGARLKSLLLEYRAGLESMILHSGHRYAISLSSRYFSTASHISEIWSGVHQLKYIKGITEKLDPEDMEIISDNMADIRKRLIVRENFSTALVGEAEFLEQGIPILTNRSLTPHVDDDVEKLSRFESPPLKVPDEIPREGWGTSTSVSFVAKTLKTVRMDHEDAPRLSVISKILRSLFLHREIREKGGAYGGFALYNIENGLFSFASYRDPHILETLNVYERASAFITSGKYQDEDIKEAILQVCSDIDKPDPPGPAAKKSFYRKIVSMKDEDRRRFKKRLLVLKKKDVVETAQRYFGAESGPYGVAVISSDDRLKQVNGKMSDSPLSLHKI
jgi:Zn-dependent M16 (insulinase) family peptidase